MGAFGLLGRKLGHSFSPQIHARLASYEYRLFEKEPEELESFMQGGEFDGINVTIPYKLAVIPYCAALSETAARIGSVNTVVRRGGELYGDNTDYYGFLYMARKSGIALSGKKALVLGNGGVSPAVREALRAMGASKVVTISRRGSDNYENLDRHADAFAIVNATPVGMYPNNGASPVDLTMFPKCSGVLDLIYNPAKTALLMQAEELGIRAENGLSMLVAQAKRACELFTGREVNDSVIDEITSEISAQTKNIILIGMPGCGKSTTGEYLAKLTGREFVDTDALIEQRAGKSIPEIFSEDGEAGFRAIETEVISNVTKRSGLVIATGGGVVTRPENRRLLMQNSSIFFLDRELDELETDGRPLSQLRSVETLRAERYDIYCRWCDRKIEYRGYEPAAKEIMEAMGL